MTNFVAIADPVSDRRENFIKTISSSIAPVPGLEVASCGNGNFQAIWAAHPQASISYEIDADGLAIVWGEAIVSGTATRVTAANLKSYWQDFPQIFDGFHACLTYNPDLGITVSADLLGIFPIYYYVDQEIILIASSPELFKHHPSYQGKFNPKGLVGILLTNGLFNGQTLWQGIYRLQAGYCLKILHQQPKEIQQYQLPNYAQQNPYANVSLEEHLDILDRLISQALDHFLSSTEGTESNQISTENHQTFTESSRTITERNRSADYTLMLSGGLDSRMLAGFITQQGMRPTALTLGNIGDMEMHCAQRVAKYLQLPHTTAPTEVNKYLDYAHLANKWEHLANGANGIALGWGIVPYLQKLPPKVVTGLCLDVAFSGPLPVANPGEIFSFDLFLKRRVNPWGIAPEILNKLLRKEIFGDLVQETIAEIQQVYESYATDEYTRNICFEYYHRERFHTGSRAWIFSLAAAPILPVLDRELLSVTALLPMREIDRLAQQQLVMTRFPELAKLPIDRNSYDLTPLLSQGMGKKARLRKKWYQLQRYWYNFQEKIGFDRRYYYKILDTNNAGWRSIRQAAESGREMTGEIFNLDILAEILPSANLPINHNYDSIIESSKVKLLATFLLWAKNNL